MKSSHRAMQMLCEFVDKHLFAIFKKSTNPACAEKKILSVMRRKGTVGEYPKWRINERLSSHVSGGSGDRAYIAPCQTCLAAYTTAGFSPQKKGGG